MNTITVLIGNNLQKILIKVGKTLKDLLKMEVGTHYLEIKKIQANNLNKLVVTILTMEINTVKVLMMTAMIQIAKMYKVKQKTMKVKIQEMYMIGVKKIQIENIH